MMPFPQKSGRRGTSILEMVFVCAMIGILTLLIFATYRMGLSATNKSLSQNELLSELQVGLRTLGSNLRQGSADSVSLAPGGSAIAFLSSSDLAGNPQIGPEGQPLWQAYIIFYHDAAEQTLKKRRIELPPASPFRTYPGPIENVDFGSGVEPIAFYLNSGAPVSRMLESFLVEEDPAIDDNYLITLKGLRPRQGVNPESRSSLKASVLVRN